MTLSDTQARPDYDFELTDGVSTISFTFADGNGNRNPRAINQYPIQRMSLKNQTGETKWSDAEFPWASHEMDDWSAGMGSKFFEDDKTRYFDGGNIDTSIEGFIYPTGDRIYGEHMYTYEYGNTIYSPQVKINVPAGTYHAIQIEPTATGYDRLELWIESWEKSTPLDIDTYGTLLIVDDNGANAPDMTDIDYGSTGNITFPQIALSLPFVFTTIASITAKCWIVLKAPSNGMTIWGYDDSTPQATYATSTDGSSWTSSQYRIAYRLVSSSIMGSQPGNQSIFFNYKGMDYMIPRQTNLAKPNLLRNGLRGIIDGTPSPSTTSIKDATLTLVQDELVGSTIVFPDYAGYLNYSTITSNETDGTIEFRALETAPTADTEYRVYSDGWYNTGVDLGADIKGVAVAGDFVYFAGGTAQAIKRYQEYPVWGGAASTWTTRITAEEGGVKANHICAVNRNGETSLYVSERGGFADYKRWEVRRYDVPRYWGPLFVRHSKPHYGTSLWTNDVPQNDIEVTYSQSRADEDTVLVYPHTGWTGPGYTASKRIAELDMTINGLYGSIYSSSHTPAAAEIRLELSDFPDGGLKDYSPIAVWKWNVASGDSVFTHAPKMCDGSTATYDGFQGKTTNFLLVGFTHRFDTVRFEFQVANAVAASNTTPYIFDGSKWVAQTWEANTMDVGGVDWSTSGYATMETDMVDVNGYIDGTNWTAWEKYTVNGVEAYYMLFVFDKDFTATTSIGRIRVTRLKNWKWSWDLATTSAYLSYPFTRGNIPAFFDITKIINIAVYNDDANEYAFTLRDLFLTGRHTDRKDNMIIIPKTQVVTQIGRYSGDASGIEKAWILTDTSIWELDENDKWTEIPLQELGMLSDGRNGDAWCQNDVYLYFNIKNMIQRYYNRNLDDIGVDRFPMTNPGNVTGMVSFPGRVYVSYGTLWGTNAWMLKGGVIFVYKNNGWHPIYRSKFIADTSNVNSPINGFFIQNVPGSSRLKMWINEGKDLFYIPVLKTPEYSALTQRAMLRGYLQTPFIQTNLADAWKVWNTVKLIQNIPPGFTATGDGSKGARCFYRLTEGGYSEEGLDDEWTEITDDFFDVGTKEVNIASTPLRAKKIQFLFVFNFDYTVRYIEAINVESYTVVPGKYSYSLSTDLLEGYLQVTLNEQPISPGNFNTRVETVMAKLKSWADDGTVLTQRCAYSPYNNKTVLLDYPSSSPIENDPEQQIEHLLLNLSTTEIR